MIRRLKSWFNPEASRVAAGIASRKQIILDSDDGED
jgi:hypothetical protein